MPKLATRQLIILGIMLLAILYGAYELFSTGRKKPAVFDTAKTAVDLNTFISEITLAMTSEAPSPVDAYMIKRAETEWLRDPFYERKNDRGWALAKEAAQA